MAGRCRSVRTCRIQALVGRGRFEVSHSGEQGLVRLVGIAAEALARDFSSALVHLGLQPNLIPAAIGRIWLSLIGSGYRNRRLNYSTSGSCVYRKATDSHC